MTIEITPEPMVGRVAAIHARAADMAQRHAEITDSVEALVEQWHGRAAARFCGLWEEWQTSAAAVINELEARVAALHYAADQLTLSDDESRVAHSNLRGRLG